VILHGIAYCVRRTAGEEAFLVTVCDVESRSETDGIVWMPKTISFLVPPTPKHTRRRTNVSDTFGLLGGIADEEMGATSEAVERAIGDVLTATICEVLIKAHKNDVAIVVLGPAFPKLIGRIASLRPAGTSNIVCISPDPFPSWVFSGELDPPRFNIGRPLAPLWEDEVLVMTELHGDSTIAQHVCVWDAAASLKLPGFGWSRKPCFGARLPRELVVAAGQIENHLRVPYRGLPENEQLQELPGGFPEREFKPAEKYRSADLGWRIKWPT
jgi:hypothetical protein